MPYFVYLLGGAVLRYTIKKIGSKTVLQIGKKTFLKKSSSAAKNAVKTFRNVSYNVGGGKKVIFTKAKMEHILKNHHPRYWTGKKNKDFFDPDFTVNDIKNIVANVINSNKSKISSALKKKRGVNVTKK